VEAAGDVLSRVAELFGDGFDRHFLVRAKAASHCLDERSQQTVHTLLLEWINHPRSIASQRG
jgi:hypothetical protein